MGSITCTKLLSLRLFGGRSSRCLLVLTMNSASTTNAIMTHVRTRISQYEAVKNGKGFEIAKRLVIGEFRGENLLLTKHGLRPEYSEIDYVENLEESIFFRDAGCISLISCFSNLSRASKIFSERICPRPIFSDRCSPYHVTTSTRSEM